ncbi:hypothetical protein AUEXF2481DRAFT_649111 [Aureobasidium subglaciale EXF-2481]|uniref:Uncharacterized protein n=1 Tax=Aureobasidium subglaciale (strain EXF-2481) TaxID=1043005 RepID=A0A074ZD94_AURSE|nr:uncharacterized protein AUEXF2481DRAFT_649111 [Aureobasidium subglaciale EXF-2481]KEQ96631.1 hypothetical protein AUEXF2481DRAFT_649111 [Aureobasidium subglaciale EXF-2481]
MSAHVYTTPRILEGRRKSNNITKRLLCQRQRQFTWDVGTSSSSISSISASPKHQDTVGDCIYIRQPRLLKSTMTLTHYSSADDEDYTSSDNDHLFMKDSPRRQSGGTASPPRSDGQLIPLRGRATSRSSPICVCRNPSAIASAASSAAAYSPVEPAIWNELRRLFRDGDPRKQFDILRRRTPADDDQGHGFILVEARVQAQDGTMIAKGEPCTDDVLSLRSLRNALMETQGVKHLPFKNGDEIIAGRIREFEKSCSACSLPRY